MHCRVHVEPLQLNPALFGGGATMALHPARRRPPVVLPTQPHANCAMLHASTRRAISRVGAGLRGPGIFSLTKDPLGEEGRDAFSSRLSEGEGLGGEDPALTPRRLKRQAQASGAAKLDSTHEQSSQRDASAVPQAVP